jgi:hypothetical protein
MFHIVGCPCRAIFPISVVSAFSPGGDRGIPAPQTGVYDVPSHSQNRSRKFLTYYNGSGSIKSENGETFDLIKEEIILR